jgi:hypothetical protein
VLRARVRSGIDRESGAPTAAPTRTDELRERKTTEAVVDRCREAVRSRWDQVSAVQFVNANVCHLGGLDR